VVALKKLVGDAPVLDGGVRLAMRRFDE